MRGRSLLPPAHEVPGFPLAANDDRPPLGAAGLQWVEDRAAAREAADAERWRLWDEERARELATFEAESAAILAPKPDDGPLDPSLYPAEDPRFEDPEDYAAFRARAADYAYTAAEFASKAAEWTDPNSELNVEANRRFQEKHGARFERMNRDLVEIEEDALEAEGILLELDDVDAWLADRRESDAARAVVEAAAERQRYIAMARAHRASQGGSDDGEPAEIA